MGFDLDRLEVTNPNPTPVLDGVITKFRGAANFDIAGDGSLVYLVGQAEGAGNGRLPVAVQSGAPELRHRVRCLGFMGLRALPLL